MNSRSKSSIMHSISVNNSNVNTPIVHTHEDFRCVYESHPLKGKGLNGKEYELLQRLIDLSCHKNGSSFQVTNGYLADKLDRSVSTITRAYRTLKALKFITISVKIESDGSTVKKHNSITVNYGIIYDYFGDLIFKDRMPRMIKFILKMIDKIKSQYRAFCSIDKPSSKEEDIHKSKGNLMSEECLEEDAPPKNEPPKFSEIIDPDDPRNKTYFDRSQTCDERHIQIALEAGMKEGAIYEEFANHRAYWIGLGHIKTAKKTDWHRTWRNWVLKAINDSYLKRNKDVDPYSANMVSVNPKPTPNVIVASESAISDRLRAALPSGVYESYIIEGATLTESDGEYKLAFKPGWRKGSFINQHRGEDICRSFGIIIE